LQVQGDGVIGMYPTLTAGGERFVYQSRTGTRSLPGRMGGHFVFAVLEHGRPTGETFNAVVPTFELALPPYVM
jgi:uncharacterized protein affecting Mg2+/Co2+ transport